MGSLKPIHVRPCSQFLSVPVQRDKSLHYDSSCLDAGCFVLRELTRVPAFLLLKQTANQIQWDLRTRCALQKNERCSILSTGAVLLSHFAILLMPPEGMHSKTQSLLAPRHCIALVISFINSCTPLTAQKMEKLMVLPCSCPLWKDQNQDCIICIRYTTNQAWSACNFPTIFFLRVTDHSLS